MMADAPGVWTVFSGTRQRSSSTFAALAPKRADASEPPPPDLDAVAAEARAEGRREGEALAQQAVQAAIAAEQDATAAALAEARRLWVEDESMALAAAFAEAIRGLEERLAASLARVLRPFLTEALRQAAISDLQATLAAIASDEQAGTLAVTGAADLAAALARRLDLPPGCLTVTAGSGPDLRIQVNGTVIESRLRAWGERVAGLVEDR